jgi:hypothetical protein
MNNRPVRGITYASLWINLLSFGLNYLAYLAYLDSINLLFVAINSFFAIEAYWVIRSSREDEDLLSIVE